MPTSDISGLSSIEPPSNWSLISRMLGLSWRYRRGCTQVVFLHVIVVALSLGGLGLTGVGIDLIGHELQSPETPRHLPAPFRFAQDWSGTQLLALIAGSILVVALMTAAMRYAAAIAVASLSQRVLVQLRSDVYDKLQRLSFRFFDRSQSSSIINRAAGDVNAVRQFVDGVIVKVLTVVLSLGVYVAYMLSMHVPLTLVCLATSPLLWWAAARFSRRVQPEYIKGGELVDRMVLTLVENVQGISVVKGFAREAARDRKILRGQSEDLRSEVRHLPQAGSVSAGDRIHDANQHDRAVGLRRAPGGDRTAGARRRSVRLRQLALRVRQPGRPDYEHRQQHPDEHHRGAACLRSARCADRNLQPAASGAARAARGAIRFEHVRFAYKAGEPVFEDLCLEIAPGECVGVVGETGSGKSTLLNLVPRYYDVQKGNVFLDGIDVRRLDLDDLRRNIGIVFQENFLFSNTVEANIAFGHPGATDADIRRAAEIAAAHEFIDELPDGYATLIGEQGSNLSGGQRQRLAIARALLFDPSDPAARRRHGLCRCGDRTRDSTRDRKRAGGPHDDPGFQPHQHAPPGRSHFRAGRRARRRMRNARRADGRIRPLSTPGRAAVCRPDERRVPLPPATIRLPIGKAKGSRREHSSRGPADSAHADAALPKRRARTRSASARFPADRPAVSVHAALRLDAQLALPVR